MFKCASVMAFIFAFGQLAFAQSTHNTDGDTLVFAYETYNAHQQYETGIAEAIDADLDGVEDSYRFRFSGDEAAVRICDLLWNRKTLLVASESGVFTLREGQAVNAPPAMSRMQGADSLLRRNKAVLFSGTDDKGFYLARYRNGEVAKRNELTVDAQHLTFSGGQFYWVQEGMLCRSPFQDLRDAVALTQIEAEDLEGSDSGLFAVSRTVEGDSIAWTLRWLDTDGHTIAQTTFNPGFVWWKAIPRLAISERSSKVYLASDLKIFSLSIVGGEFGEPVLFRENRAYPFGSVTALAVK